MKSISLNQVKTYTDNNNYFAVRYIHLIHALPLVRFQETQEIDSHVTGLKEQQCIKTKRVTTIPEISRHPSSVDLGVVLELDMVCHPPLRVFLHPGKRVVCITSLTKAKNCCRSEFIAIWLKLWKKTFLQIFGMLYSCTNCTGCLLNTKLHAEVHSMLSDVHLQDISYNYLRITLTHTDSMVIKYIGKITGNRIIT